MEKLLLIHRDGYDGDTFHGFEAESVEIAKQELARIYKEVYDFDPAAAQHDFTFHGQRIHIYGLDNSINDYEIMSLDEFWRDCKGE